MNKVLRDDALTVAAIAVLAFIVTDIGHETLGHGVGYWLAGGHSAIVTTTHLIPDHQLAPDPAELLDLGGPAGDLACAFVSWLFLRAKLNPATRLFFWLTMAFSLFWTFGYMMFCGAVGKGDWFALIRGSQLIHVWRVALIGLGLLLYFGSERLVGDTAGWLGSRARRVTLISYLAASIISCAGTFLDPGGPWEIVNSGALTGFATQLGLLRSAVPRWEETSDNLPMPRSPGWICAAAAGAVFFVFILGRGVKIHI